MTSREIVYRTVTFQKPERLGWEMPEEFGNDFYYRTMQGYTDQFLSRGIDAWGSVWNNLGQSNLGEVVEFPLKTWADLDKITVPDMDDLSRYANLKTARREAGDKFLIAFGNSIYTRICFLRGLENTWTDIYEEPENLKKLIDLMVTMNLKAIPRYAENGYDGYFLLDDWGLQNTLMISPEKWREFFKPAYKEVFDAVHRAGMLVFLHSCGYILDILGDLIEIGLDVIQMDQQTNMGLENLAAYAGKICFFNPVDIQAVMPKNDLDEIRSYCRKMVGLLSRDRAGFMLRWYSDYRAAGHQPEGIRAMCEEFMKIARQP